MIDCSMSSEQSILCLPCRCTQRYSGGTTSSRHWQIMNSILSLIMHSIPRISCSSSTISESLCIESPTQSTGKSFTTFPTIISSLSSLPPCHPHSTPSVCPLPSPLTQCHCHCYYNLLRDAALNLAARNLYRRYTVMGNDRVLEAF